LQLASTQLLRSENNSVRLLLLIEILVLALIDSRLPEYACEYLWVATTITVLCTALALAPTTTTTTPTIANTQTNGG
jgi:hypothetical protein